MEISISIIEYAVTFEVRGKQKVKEKIHPQYRMTTARCACGNEIEVGSTKENIKVEVCSKCHPFYTGNKGRVVDTTGRVDRFKKKYGLQ